MYFVGKEPVKYVVSIKYTSLVILIRTGKTPVLY